VAVVRAEETEFSSGEGLSDLERVLVPTAGGPNSKLAIDLALSLSEQSQITALSVARQAQGEVGRSLSQQRLEDFLEPWAGQSRVEGKVVSASSPTNGILAEAAKGYDLVLVGASHESYLDRVLFGNIPQTVAARSPVPSIVVRTREGRQVMGTWFRRVGWNIYHVLPTLDLHRQIEVYKAIREGAQPKVDFYVMMALAAAIATFGLLQNSPAVIIGAMLVAPLMSAIFGLSLGMVRGDPRLLKRAASATLRGVLVSITVAVALAWLMPSRILSEEILLRANPNLLDLGVALASGAAGAYALCRKDVSASLPGVAIAAALVPPLAVVGIGLGRLDGQVAGGASLLFVTNLAAISAAAGLVFLWLGFRPLPGRQDRRLVFRGGVLGTLVLLVLVTALLALLTVESLGEANLNRRAEVTLKQEIRGMPGVDWDGEWTLQEQDDGTLGIDVWVRSRRDVTYREVVELQEELATVLERTVALRLSVIPSTQLDPLVPPTPTPTPLPGATATGTPSPIPTPTATFTPTPSPTASPTSEPTSTPTHTPSYTPTSSPTPTRTPTPTHTPTYTPTPTPTPTPVLVEVGGTGGQGAWLFTQPTLNSGKIRAWRDGTLMRVAGGPVAADGYTWILVDTPTGQLGWIPERFLIFLSRPPD
jgi:uncharacterized hydrophobic protein (TIGR00271 family)